MMFNDLITLDATVIFRLYVVSSGFPNKTAFTDVSRQKSDEPPETFHRIIGKFSPYLHLIWYIYKQYLPKTFLCTKKNIGNKNTGRGLFFSIWFSDWDCECCCLKIHLWLKKLHVQSYTYKKVSKFFIISLFFCLKSSQKLNTFWCNVFRVWDIALKN